MKAFLGGLIIGGAAVALVYSYLPKPPAMEHMPQRQHTTGDTAFDETAYVHRLFAQQTTARREVSPLWPEHAPGKNLLPSEIEVGTGPLIVAEIKPALDITPPDIASVSFCSSYSGNMPLESEADYDDIVFDITLEPTTEFRAKLLTFAKDSISETGFSPFFYLMDNFYRTPLNTWQASRESLARYSDDLWPEQATWITLHYKFRDISAAFGLLSSFRGNGLKLCTDEGPSYDFLIRLMDARWGDNSAIFLK
ncbi:hypothetical protein [Kordiimonas sp.]|uniref:hypothetical protein n=1 Tax=Kordiimonas sp. TaxID=1970157 RepID=UPI003A95D0D0